jgi:hypothetical protein
VTSLFPHPPVQHSPTTNRRSLTTLVVAVLLAALFQGCVSVPKREPVPDAIYESATVPGIPRARFWGDATPPYYKGWLARSTEELKAEYPTAFGREHVYLAVSGGGANGAFAAGLLKGWTATGTRPEFTIVTGISTGALIAPFAMLGPEYDSLLQEFYTAYGTKDLIHKRKVVNSLTSDAMYGTDGLEGLIAEYVTEEVMQKLADKHLQGRQVLIGTTDIDAGRPVIWNIGRIAASGEPFALDLIHQILLASASIPVAFPPVAIDVEAQGRPYQELHVDGGTASQVFLYPAGIPWDELLEKLEVPGTPKAYIIRNSRLDPQAAAVNRKLLPIAERTISSLIRSQGIGDLYRIFALAERDGLEFNLAYIPKEFDAQPTELFDPTYMKQLYDLAYEMGKSGYQWYKAPPGFNRDSP